VLYFVVPFFLLLEYLFPCNPFQQLFGKGFLQDAVWFAAAAPTTILFLGAVNEFFHGLYDKHLAFLTIRSAAAWSTYLQIIAAISVVEFLWWMSHLVRHKLPTLWLFHAVHHSQKELNVFTEDRVHVVDTRVVDLPRNWFMQILFPFVQFFRQIAPRPLYVRTKNKQSRLTEST
jgi:sterol desaturase/sphingolipid hydroxylase (fatty acid hydroxylase superfamily)